MGGMYQTLCQSQTHAPKMHPIRENVGLKCGYLQWQLLLEEVVGVVNVGSKEERRLGAG
jgi:hypothetical protein